MRIGVIQQICLFTHLFIKRKARSSVKRGRLKILDHSIRLAIDIDSLTNAVLREIQIYDAARL